jgi:hypothetical protein
MSRLVKPRRQCSQPTRLWNNGNDHIHLETYEIRREHIIRRTFLVGRTKLVLDTFAFDVTQFVHALAEGISLKLSRC